MPAVRGHGLALGNIECQMATRDQLDDRKAAILRAVVEEYVETAAPVGSQAIASASRLGVSSATVRNDMTVLEREGYLHQPHTSAGRVPTDRGYRFFVDNFTDHEALPPEHGQVVTRFFSSAHQALEDLLHETSQLLSRVSSHAAVVVGPQPDAAQVRSVQLVMLQARLVLVVVVLSNGGVEKQLLHLEVDTDEVVVHAAGALLSAQIEHQPWRALPEQRFDVAGSGPGTTGAGPAEALAAVARDALAELARAEGIEPFYVGGASRLAAEHGAFSTTLGAARLLELLEQQVIVVSLVRELLTAGVNVSIGSENRIDDLHDCSIVVASYEVEGHPAGMVGVLGPTRMNYRHALAAVSAVSEQLGRHLS